MCRKMADGQAKRAENRVACGPFLAKRRTLMRQELFPRIQFYFLLPHGLDPDLMELAYSLRNL